MAIILFGKLDKRLFFSLAYIIIYAFFFIYWLYYDNNIVSLYIKNFGYSIGEILIIFINKVFKYKRVVKKIITIKKNYFKDFFFLALIEIFWQLSDLFEIFFKENDKEESYGDLYINDGLSIIFLALSSYWILNYRYYKHHIISVATFVSFSIIIDIVLDKFSKANYILIINTIFYTFVNTLLSIVYKYLIEIKYHYFLDVIVIDGVIFFMTNLISFLIIIFIPNIKDSKTFIDLFLEYYDKLGLSNIIFQIFFCIIIYGLGISLLGIIILNEFNPDHVQISYELARIPASIMTINGFHRWIILVISIFQIFCLLFYLEIFECNFCSLNKNTKRSISERGPVQEKFTDKDNKIIIKGYDMTEAIKNQEKINIELANKENDDNCD